MATSANPVVAWGRRPSHEEILTGTWFGIALGSLLSAWIVLSSSVFLINEGWNHSEGRIIAALFHPLAFNSPVEFALLFLFLFLSPAVPGFLSCRRGGKLWDAITAGALAGLLIFVVTAVAGIIRMNMVLEIIRNRPEWHQALLVFAGSRGIAARANAYYAEQVPERLLMGTAFGALIGALGGLLAKILGCYGILF